MTLSWPFVGRDRELVVARDALRRPGGGGLLLAGPAGAGKTRIAEEACQVVDSGRESLIRVTGTEATSALPYGALGHLLPAVLPRAAEFNLIGWAASALGTMAGDRRLVVFADDAHLLDPASAALIHDLVAHRDAKILATLRAWERAPDTIVALWKDSLVGRLDVGPISREETRLLLEGVLSGQVEAGTVHRLHHLSQGNLLYLRELVDAALTAGTLAPVGETLRGLGANQVWRWSGDPPEAPRLRELIESRIGGLTDDEQAVLELVSFGEPLGVALLASITGAAAVESAEAKHLIAVRVEGRRVRASPAHPLYAEIVRSRCPPPRRRRRLRELAAAIERRGARRREDALRVATWRLDSGTAHDPRTLTIACRQAYAAGDVQLARRLGWAAMNADGDPEVTAEVAAMLARVLVVAGLPDEAVAALATVDETSLSERLLAKVLFAKLVTLNFGLGRTGDADGVYTDALRRIRDPALIGGLTAQHAYHLVMRGRCEQALRLLPAGETDPALPGHAVAAVARGTALIQVGRCAEAADLCDAVLAGLSGDVRQRGSAPETLLALEMTRHVAGFMAGDLAGIRAKVTGARRTTIEGKPWTIAQAVLGLCLAQVERVSGAVGEALRLGRESMALLAGTPYGSVFAGEMAHAAALRGDLAEAEKALATARGTLSPAMRLGGFWIEIAQPWVEVLRGGAEAGVTRALSVAGRARATGLHAFEMLALHDVVRLAPSGSAPVVRAATRLTEIGAIFEGRLAAAAAAHGRAAAAADPAGLTAASRAFEDIGMPLHAAEAAAQAATALLAAGRAVSARAASARAWNLAARCDGVHTPALSGVRAPGLTNRESEVARLAAAGLSSREIADRLTTSVRTVDNHLRAVYTKLGVTGRGGLGEVGMG